MKTYLTLCCLLLSASLWAQHDTAGKAPMKMKGTYQLHSTIATIGLGFIDNNRQNYTLPAGFSKGMVTGFIPFFARIEYGLTRTVSIGASLGYDAYVYNNKHDFTGNNGAFSRYAANNTRILSGGLAVFYHLGSARHSRNLDPFIGAGVALNNIRYSAYPQGDSTALKVDHSLTPYLKAGVRYFISDRFSLYGDVGLDQQAIITLGASCRFFNKRSL